MCVYVCVFVCVVQTLYTYYSLMLITKQTNTTHLYLVGYTYPVYLYNIFNNDSVTSLPTL